jgi:rod shape-determining protein MreB
MDSQEPFTTRRLLIGEFLPAEATLREAMKQLRPGPAYLADPVVVIHPLVMTEGGLSAVENRVLMEVADGAGAKRVTVWTGHQLSDDEVRDKARAA